MQDSIVPSLYQQDYTSATSSFKESSALNNDKDEKESFQESALLQPKNASSNAIPVYFPWVSRQIDLQNFSAYSGYNPKYITTETNYMFGDWGEYGFRYNSEVGAVERYEDYGAANKPIDYWESGNSLRIQLPQRVLVVNEKSDLDSIGSIVFSIEKRNWQLVPETASRPGFLYTQASETPFIHPLATRKQGATFRMDSYLGELGTIAQQADQPWSYTNRVQNNYICMIEVKWNQYTKQQELHLWNPSNPLSSDMRRLIDSPYRGRLTLGDVAYRTNTLSEIQGIWRSDYVDTFYIALNNLHGTNHPTDMVPSSILFYQGILMGIVYLTESSGGTTTNRGVRFIVVKQWNGNHIALYNPIDNVGESIYYTYDPETDPGAVFNFQMIQNPIYTYRIGSDGYIYVGNTGYLPKYFYKSFLADDTLILNINQKCNICPEDLEVDKELDEEKRTFLIDYQRYMCDKFSLRIGAATTYKLPVFTLEYLDPLGLLLEYNSFLGSFYSYETTAYTRYNIELTQFIPGEDPIHHTLTITRPHALGKIHMAIPHHADYYIRASRRKQKFMQNVIKYYRPLMHFWNDPFNMILTRDPRSYKFTPGVIDDWFLPQSSFYFRGEGPRRFLNASGLVNHSRLVLDGKTVIDKYPAVSNASMYISANNLPPAYFFINSYMHHSNVYEEYFILETGYYRHFFYLYFTSYGTLYAKSYIGDWVETFTVNVSTCFMKISFERIPGSIVRSETFKITFDFMNSARYSLKQFYILRELTPPHYFVKMRFPSLPSHFENYYWLTNIYQDPSRSVPRDTLMDTCAWSNKILEYETIRFKETHVQGSNESVDSYSLVIPSTTRVLEPSRDGVVSETASQDQSTNVAPSDYTIQVEQTSQIVSNPFDRDPNPLLNMHKTFTLQSVLSSETWDYAKNLVLSHISLCQRDGQTLEQNHALPFTCLFYMTHQVGKHLCWLEIVSSLDDRVLAQLHSDLATETLVLVNSNRMHESCCVNNCLIQLDVCLSESNSTVVRVNILSLDDQVLHSMHVPIDATMDESIQIRFPCLIQQIASNTKRDIEIIKRISSSQSQ